MRKARSIQACAAARSRPLKRLLHGAGDRADALLDQRRRLAHVSDGLTAIVENADVPLQPILGHRRRAAPARRRSGPRLFERPRSRRGYDRRARAVCGQIAPGHREFGMRCCDKSSKAAAKARRSLASASAPAFALNSAIAASTSAVGTRRCAILASRSATSLSLRQLCELRSSAGPAQIEASEKVGVLIC